MVIDVLADQRGCTEDGRAVAHAARHLALLAVTDPVVADALRGHGAVFAGLSACAPGLAGPLA